MIPFKYGSVVSGKDFCGRKDYIKELSKFVVSSQNVLIQGERRIEKLKHKIIFKVNNEYRFFNPFFKAWISYKNL